MKNKLSAVAALPVVVILVFIVLIIKYDGNSRDYAFKKIPAYSYVPLNAASDVGLFVEMEDLFRGREKMGVAAYVFKTGEPITVTAVTLVLGNESVSLGYGKVLSYYDIYITDEEGASVQKTDRWHFDYSRKIGGPASFTHVNASRPFVESFTVDQWFDLSDPGLYTLRVARAVVVSDTVHYIEGPPVRFQIVEDPDSFIPEW